MGDKIKWNQRDEKETENKPSNIRTETQWHEHSVIFNKLEYTFWLKVR